MIDTGTTWTSCLKITRADGIVIGLTELDTALVIAGVDYLSISGYTPTTFSTTADLAVNNADVEGLLDAAGIDRAEILAGRFDRADIELFIWDWSAATLVKTLATGNWGECTLHEGRFVAEFRSLSQRLQQTVGEVYSPTCRARLGDARCTVDTAALSVSGTIDSQPDALTLVDAARSEADNAWRGGVLTFTSGANDGRAYEIKASLATGVLGMLLPVAHPVAAGDAYDLIPGCDGSLAMCRDLYDNVINFRGEPHIPGVIEILRIGKSGQYALPDGSVDPDAPTGTPTGPYSVTTSLYGGTSFSSADLTEADGYWDGARCEWVTGANTGFYATVAAYTVGDVLLDNAMPYDIAGGDTFTLTL